MNLFKVGLTIGIIALAKTSSGVELKDLKFTCEANNDFTGCASTQAIEMSKQLKIYDCGTVATPTCKKLTVPNNRGLWVECTTKSSECFNVKDTKDCPGTMVLFVRATNICTTTTVAQSDCKEPECKIDDLKKTLTKSRCEVKNYVCQSDESKRFTKPAFGYPIVCGFVTSRCFSVAQPAMCPSGSDAQNFTASNTLCVRSNRRHVEGPATGVGQP